MPHPDDFAPGRGCCPACCGMCYPGGGEDREYPESASCWNLHPEIEPKTPEASK